MDDDLKAHAEDFMFHDPESMQAPGAFYDRMRRECPVGHSTKLGGYYFTTTFEGTKRVYDDFRTFTSKDGTALPKQPMVLLPSDIDPPEQTRLRRLLNPFFLPDAAERLRPRIQTVIDELFDQVAGKGEMEILDELARPMLSGVVLPFLGVPLSDRRMLAEKLDFLVRCRAGDPEGSARVGEEIGGYLIALTNGRRAGERQDDILQLLIEAEVDGERLDDMEILGILTLVLFGGLDTTTAALGEALLHLARHPEDAERLRTGAVPWSRAVEEFVRYASPVHGLRRTVTCPVELEGTQLQAGDFIMAMNGAGNRDPRKFENPDTIRIDREIDVPRGHLGFGAGAHICLGQHFARVMMELLLKTVLTRIPDFRVPDDFEPEYAVGESRVMKRLPVTFTPATKHAAA
ncbi:cytochrome P450 [Sphingomonas sp. CGMCC 1.13654]|uniref:Cytochrome P450 n=1 Tax=Sphingomonas chungangi TaxID=2683589 RepID=A0A838L5F1_9SPHN|nr:cytochrome P450 [Sphingomonas chungangi]MBA2933842.1 cytochrome P450 [Sphingomonas chungangi]MVW55172.1 cytochrome P450 [Sphingomonas chungangi]